MLVVDSGDSWPPNFPTDMPAKPYHYETGSAWDGGSELLWITQTKEAKSKTYNFKYVLLTLTNNYA